MSNPANMTGTATTPSSMTPIMDPVQSPPLHPVLLPYKYNPATAAGGTNIAVRAKYSRSRKPVTLRQAEGNRNGMNAAVSTNRVKPDMQISNEPVLYTPRS
jgi:hypothetical protein